MKTLILLSFLTVALCSPFDFLKNGYHSIINKFSSRGAYSYAATVAQFVPSISFICIKQAGYSAAFIRVYKSDNTGSVDYDGIQNIKNANAGLGVEIYIKPQPQSIKTAVAQFDEAYTALISAGISVNAIWLQVTSPIDWSNYSTSNINFITSFLNRAKQYSLYLGVFTNWYDWQQITNSYTGLSSIGDVRLWYWNAYGTGVGAASSLDFSDFRAFASFATPAVKQYSLAANICSTTINQNVFSTRASKRSMLRSNKTDIITVGTIQF